MADNGFSGPVFFIDDGVSGVTFDKPGFNRMITEIETRNVVTAIVRDISRLGRDYLEVGYYTEISFVERDVRYIAINGGVGNAKGGNDFTPFRNLFNDFYAEDASKEIRAVKRAQDMAGEHLTKPPYGYIVNSTDKKQWIVDEEAAVVVKRIFDLYIDGRGPTQIVKILKADSVLIAKTYYAKKKGKALPDNLYNWKDSSIVGVLERMNYCGYTVNFKNYSESHKLKKWVSATKEQQTVFYSTYETVVEGAVSRRVQELRVNKRHPTKAERQGLFSGLMYYVDCGSKLHFATCKSFNGLQDHYRCVKYKNNTGSCTAHFVREKVLKQIV